MSSLSFSFSYDQILLFSILSRDKNPFHINYYFPYDYPRSKVVCHGALLLLKSLDICKQSPESFTVHWFSPVHSNEFVNLIVEPNRIIGVSNSGQLYYQIYLHQSSTGLFKSPVQLKNNNQLFLQCADRSHCHSKTDIKNLVDTDIYTHLNYNSDDSLLTLLFPWLSANLSRNILEYIMSASHFVGMVAPGLHSLFLSYNFNSLPHATTCSTSADYFRINSFSESTSLLNISGFHPTAQSTISASILITNYQQNLLILQLIIQFNMHKDSKK